MDMSADDVEQYWKAVSVIEAQESLLQLNISDFPYLKGNSRKKMHRQISKVANFKFEDGNSKGMSTLEAARIVAGKM